MSESDDRIERAIRKVIGDVAPTPTQLPPPSEAPYASPRAAIACCREAWQKAYDAYMEKNARKDGGMAETYAEKEAAVAFRTAMPQLAGFNGIRDFIACVAYGVLIDAIPAERTGQLLYPAQTALALLPRIPPC
jgi:hypothetical protein